MTSEIALTQSVVVQNEDGRIVVMDSMTYADHRNYNCDVLIAASYFGAMPVCHWILPVNPKGVIAHAAGGGRNMAGVSGLWSLDAMGIPGAAASTDSCRISDGTDVYENGIVEHVNSSARDLGITRNMPIKEAARLMLARHRVFPESVPQIVEVYHSERGKIIAVGSVSFLADSNAGDVICAGSNFSTPSAAYSMRFKFRGVICNDAGRCKDDSGVAGLGVIEQAGIPAAVVSAGSAEIGDGMSTYRDGVISLFNESAQKIGITEGMTATSAALLMLERDL